MTITCTNENKLLLNNEVIGRFEIAKNANGCANILEFHCKDIYITLFDGNKSYPKKNVDITKIFITNSSRRDSNTIIDASIILSNITHSSGNIRNNIQDECMKCTKCKDTILFHIISGVGYQDSIDILFKNNKIDIDDATIIYNSDWHKSDTVKAFENAYNKMIMEQKQKNNGGYIMSNTINDNYYGKPYNKIMIKDIEEQIFALEGVRVVFRCSSTIVTYGYNYTKKYDDNKPVINWIIDRLTTIKIRYQNGCINDEISAEYDIIVNDHVLTDKSITMKQLRKLTNKPVINNNITEESIMKNAIVDGRNIEEPVINWE